MHVGFLTMTNGTFKIVRHVHVQQSESLTPPPIQFRATGGFWMNNPNATVVGPERFADHHRVVQNVAGHVQHRHRYRQFDGLWHWRVYYRRGWGNQCDGAIAVSAASQHNAITYTQTGGTITVCTVGNASTTLASFDLGTATGSTSTSPAARLLSSLRIQAAPGRAIIVTSLALTGTTTVTGGTRAVG